MSGAAFTALLIFPGQALGQQPNAPPVASHETEVEELKPPEQTVDVQAPARDEEIAERLTRILKSTGRFVVPTVRVDNGVVFLTGRTHNAEFKTWARELAAKTQDVVAVVNNIEVDEGPIWNLAPARQELLALTREAAQALPLIAIGLVILVVVSLFSGLVSRGISRFLTRGVQSRIFRGVIEKTFFLLVVVLGVYVFLRVSGLTRIAATLIGGTGLAGLVIGLAFRDIAENFLASILISVQRPFRIGDTIEVDGRLGVVQKVTMRGTVLMDFDGSFIQMLNSTVYKSTIRNLTANPSVRLKFTVGIGYDVDIPRAQEVARKVLEAHPAVLTEPEPLVLVEQLGAATITMRVYYWINVREHSQFKVQSAIIRQSVAAFLEAGISLPDEAREVVFPKAVPIQLLEQEDSAPPPPPPTPRAPEKAQEIVPAEGNLRPEAEEIRRQAEQARPPEEGEDILRKS